MATAARRRSIYTTEGSMAYDPAYAPRHEREERTEPLVRTRERVAGRTQVRVRQAGYVAPVAVLGFAMIAVMAILVLTQYAQLAKTSDKIVHLRSESAALAAENAKLQTQYELAFDLKSVEEQVAASGTMVQPQPGQIITLNVVEPDSAQLYTHQGENIPAKLWNGLSEAVNNIVAFFR